MKKIIFLIAGINLVTFQTMSLVNADTDSAQQTLTIGQIKKNLTTLGPKKTMQWLFDDTYRSHIFFNKISSGQTPWLRILPTFMEHSDGSYTSTIQMGIALALEHNPEEALRLTSKEITKNKQEPESVFRPQHVCSLNTEDFSENESPAEEKKSATTAIEKLEKRKKALAQITKQNLVAEKTICINQISKAINRWKETVSSTH